MWMRQRLSGANGLSTTTSATSASGEGVRLPTYGRLLTALAGGLSSSMRRCCDRHDGRTITSPTSRGAMVGRLESGCLLIVLLNLRRMAIRILRDRTLRAHPERAPRESAALWYDRMVDRLARRDGANRRRKRHSILSQRFRKRTAEEGARALRALTNLHALASRWMTLKPCRRCSKRSRTPKLYTRK
jgi:hypothetical protein